MRKNIEVKVNDVLINKHSGRKFMVNKVYRNNEIALAIEIEVSNPTTRAISKDELLYGYYEINNHYNL